nr:eukaryotic translation initiation factor 2 subunit beta [Seculamonas ecuadoriensis]
MGNLYRYTELLTRVFDVMREKNMDGGPKKRTLKQPHVVKDGSRKTAFTNFLDICKSMNRDPDHVLSYLLGELGTTGNLDGNESLIIRGKFQSKNITSILRRYINEYVLCMMCRSLDTNLTRDPATRLHRMECETCSATRSVAPINKGYTAVIKRPRK